MKWSIWYICKMDVIIRTYIGFIIAYILLNTEYCFRKEDTLFLSSNFPPKQLFRNINGCLLKRATSRQWLILHIIALNYPLL